MKREGASSVSGVDVERACAPAVWTRRDIDAILAAPTPDNNQPWLLETRKTTLAIRLDRSRLLPSDVDGMFDLIGLGAALANLHIVRSQANDTDALPVLIENADGELVEPPRDVWPPLSPDVCRELATEVPRRHTNRRPYARRVPKREDLDALAGAAEADGVLEHRCRVTWLTERSAIGKFAGLVARCDRLRFEYPAFHAELFKQLRFHPSEVQQRGDGLDVRTLELPPGAATFLRCLRSWSAMRIFKRLGGTRLMALPSRWSVLHSGAIGLLAMRVSHDDADLASVSLQQWREHCLVAGAALQRLWLKASQLDVAIQPLGSLPLFFARIHRLRGEGLTARDQEAVQRL
ncbi:MAG TPA: hypothetical protein ENJ50_06600, partial [Planctomycetaceae bacterium]|nr:hypothetical protein [Planctomycetaceae bacterium]